MKILTCPKCQSQFDVSTMQAGSNFVCGKCRNVLQVPAAAPVIQPTPVVQPVAAPPVQPAARRPAAPPPSSAPATVVLSPDEMRRALAAAKGAAPEPAPQKSQPKLPPAMEARRAQAAQSSAASRAGGPSASQQPAPQAAPAPAPRPVARPAAAPAGKPTPAPVAKAAAPAPAAAKASAPAAKPAAAGGRSSRRARGGDEAEGDEGAPKKKSQTPMYAAIGVGALAVVAGLVVALRKGDTPADTAGGTPATQPATAGVGDAAGAAAKTPEPANLDEWGKFLRMSGPEQQGFAATKRNEATGNVEKLKALFDWFSDPRLSTNAEAKKTVAAVVDDALRADGSTEWANVAKGRKNVYEMLRVARQDYAKAFQYKEKDEDDVDAAMQKFEKDRWVDQKEYAKWEVVANRIRDRNKQFDSDPRLVKVETKKAFIKSNKLFAEFKFVYRWADPYLICQQYEEYTDPELAHKNKERLANVNKFANRDAIIFTELNRHFRSLFAERFKLPELKEKDRILFALVLWNHESYVDFYRKANNGETPAPYIRAFYSPPEQKIFHYIGDDSMRAQDELPVANNRVQKGSDQVTFHEGTHQLQHEYSAIFKGKPLVDGDTVVSPRKSMWWEEGIAEFMGSVEVENSKKDDLVGAQFFHNRLLLERLKDVRGDGRSSNLREVARKWTIAEMIVPNHNGELLQKSSAFTPNNPSLGAVLFYGRAWGLTHFFWFYDNGKYRKQYLDYMEKVLRDEQGPDALAKCFGRKNPKDWKGIDEEFEWYWDRCLARPIGWKDPEGKTRPYNTDTDPPTGAFDPNAKEDE